MKTETKTKLLNRLRRVEGQVRGIARMVEEDRHTIDVLTQLQAARVAMSRVETELLKDHLGQLIESTIGMTIEQQREKAEELIGVLERGLR
jgi:CsoR family transcriptional regulator, copper-sensing transcriptional repressor